MANNFDSCHGIQIGGKMAYKLVESCFLTRHWLTKLISFICLKWRKTNNDSNRFDIKNLHRPETKLVWVSTLGPFSNCFFSNANFFIKIFSTKYIYTLPLQKKFVSIGQTLVKLEGSEISKTSMLVAFWNCFRQKCKCNLSYELLLGAKIFSEKWQFSPKLLPPPLQIFEDPKILGWDYSLVPRLNDLAVSHSIYCCTSGATKVFLPNIPRYDYSVWTQSLAFCIRILNKVWLKWN